MPLGPRDTGQLVTLTGWDADELLQYQLRDGTTFAQVVAMMNTALAALNNELATSPVWSTILSFTQEPTVEYRVGVSNGFELFTEYGRPDSKRADEEGHMLPLIPYDRGLGWTWNFLRKARMSQIENDVADAIKDGRDRFRQSLLTRILKRTDDSGIAAGLGSSGYSTGFATAAASTNVDFTPPAWRGNTFDSDHEHYVGIAGGAFTTAVFTDARAELLEHGHEPPFDFWIGETDRATVAALTETTATPAELIIPGQDTAVPTFGINRVDGSYYIGTNSDFRIRVVPGMPQYYGVGFKSYGLNSQRNPIRVRLSDTARPTFTAFPDPRSGAGAVYPLQYLMLFIEYGVGVGDRTAATPRYTNNATWADGTPT